MTVEVAEPILNTPFAQPERHWYLREGGAPEQRAGHDVTRHRQADAVSRAAYCSAESARSKIPRVAKVARSTSKPCWRSGVE